MPYEFELDEARAVSSLFQDSGNHVGGCDASGSRHFSCQATPEEILGGRSADSGAAR